MGSVTYRFLANDILEVYNANTDDSELGLTQVIFWINTIASRLLMQHIRKLPTGAHLLVFNNVPISVEPVSNRKFFDLPRSVYDFSHERGIDYVTYQDITDCCDPPAFTQNTFNMTTARDSKRLYFDPYEEPSAVNPYFYRTDSKVFLLGLECVAVPKGLEMGLYATIDPNIDGCNLDDEISLSEELITVLRNEVLALGRFAFIIPAEKVNEGADQTSSAVQQQNIQIPQVRQAGGVPEEQQNQ